MDRRVLTDRFTDRAIVQLPPAATLEKHLGIARLSIALAGVLLAAGCAARSNATLLPQSGGNAPLTTPNSVSPGSIQAAPMAKTVLQPPSAMHSARAPMIAIKGMSWAQIPGTASEVAASQDGSLWALSTQPSGPDKYIWRYAAGTWTNISGLAKHLAVAPNGTLYAINSGGGAYAYISGTWNALGGGASAIATAPDNSFYVLSNGSPAGSDQAIWHNVSGTWTQIAGSGVAIAASFDTGTYTLPSGTVSSGGLYIVNSQGAIYYENAGGSFTQLPGTASAIAPTQTGGGVFAAGYPANSNGNAIYYYNLISPGWSVQGGTVTNLSSSGGQLYVVGPSGAIYSSPIAPAPVSAPPGTFALTIVNNNSAIFSNNINLYIYGGNYSNHAITLGVNADGSTYQINKGTQLQPIPWSGGTTNQETVYLPKLHSARVYIADGTSLSRFFIGNASAGISGPAPWTNDGSQGTYWDYIEYTSGFNVTDNVNYDVSQVDGIGLAMKIETTGGLNSSTSTATPPPIGLMPGAVASMASALNAVGTPYNLLTAQMPYHITSASHGMQTSKLIDNEIMGAWNTYINNWMEITAQTLSSTTYNGNLWGTVNSSGDFDFYSAPNTTTGTYVGTIRSPQNYASLNPTFTITGQVVAQNGAFLDFTTPNVTFPSLGPAVGNRLSGAINSGVMQQNPLPSPPNPPPSFGQLLTVQPICSNSARFPVPAVNYENLYAAQLTNVAATMAYVPYSVYAYPYDDLCGNSTDTTVYTTSTQSISMKITINNS